MSLPKAFYLWGFTTLLLTGLMNLALFTVQPHGMHWLDVGLAVVCLVTAIYCLCLGRGFR